jgi:signal transduction histidine kinase
VDITERKEVERMLKEYQRKLKSLVSQLTITEETERRRIAADLHDHIGHSLSLARMQLKEVLETQSELEKNLLVKDISNILLQTIRDTRGLIFELSSPSLNEIGLAAAISEWLEERIAKRYDLEIEFIDDIHDDRRKTLDENVRALLFRNVRELLTNVVKHARADKVLVYITEDDARVKIVVEDDGVGFDLDTGATKNKQDNGFGLFSIRERMTDLSGSFDIQSEPGKGCRVVLTVPVEM